MIIIDFVLFLNGGIGAKVTLRRHEVASIMDGFRVRVSEDAVVLFLKLVIRVLLNNVEIKNSGYILHN